MKILSLLFGLALAVAAHASNVTLAWNPETDPTVVGYNIYEGGASRSYTNMISLGLVTSCTVSNLTPGATYYFAVTAYTIVGLESQFSAELSYTVPSNAPPTIPVFTLQPVSSTNNFGSTLTLTANAGTNCVYQWRLTGTNLPGATTTSLTLPFLTWTNNGAYTLQASNSAGVTISAAATVSVRPPTVANVRVTGP